MPQGYIAAGLQGFHQGFSQMGGYQGLARKFGWHEQDEYEPIVDPEMIQDFQIAEQTGPFGQQQFAEKWGPNFEIPEEQDPVHYFFGGPETELPPMPEMTVGFTQDGNPIEATDLDNLIFHEVDTATGARAPIPRPQLESLLAKSGMGHLIPDEPDDPDAPGLSEHVSLEDAAGWLTPEDLAKEYDIDQGIAQRLADARAPTHPDYVPETVQGHIGRRLQDTPEGAYIYEYGDDMFLKVNPITESYNILNQQQAAEEYDFIDEIKTEEDVYEPMGFDDLEPYYQDALFSQAVGLDWEKPPGYEDVSAEDFITTFERMTEEPDDVTPPPQENASIMDAPVGYYEGNPVYRFKGFEAYTAYDPNTGEYQPLDDSLWDEVLPHYTSPTEVDVGLIMELDSRIPQEIADDHAGQLERPVEAQRIVNLAAGYTPDIEEMYYTQILEQDLLGIEPRHQGTRESYYERNPHLRQDTPPVEEELDETETGFTPPEDDIEADALRRGLDIGVGDLREEFIGDEPIQPGLQYWREHTQQQGIEHADTPGELAQAMAERGDEQLRRAIEDTYGVGFGEFIASLERLDIIRQEAPIGILEGMAGREALAEERLGLAEEFEGLIPPDTIPEEIDDATNNQGISELLKAIYIAEGGEGASVPFGLLGFEGQGYKFTTGVRQEKFRDLMEAVGPVNMEEDREKYMAIAAAATVDAYLENFFGEGVNWAELSVSDKREFIDWFSEYWAPTEGEGLRPAEVDLNPNLPINLKNILGL